MTDKTDIFCVCLHHSSYHVALADNDYGQCGYGRGCSCTGLVAATVARPFASERIDPGVEAARRDDLAREAVDQFKAVQDQEMPLRLYQAMVRLADAYRPETPDSDDLG